MNEETKPNCTGFLFSDPTFLKGAGNIFNIWGNYYTFNYSRTTEEADERAIANDWKIIGKDLLDAMGNTENKIESIEEGCLDEG